MDQDHPSNSALRTSDVLCSTFSCAGLRKLFYPHYDLDPSTHCTLFRRYLNDVYLLSFGDQRYALKVYQSEWRPTAAILGELEAIWHLAARGIDVALPVARKDGQWITELPAPEGRRSAVLFHWVDGERPRWSEPAHSARFGKLIAQVHSAADDMPSNGTRPHMTIEHVLGDSLARIRPALADAPEQAQRCEAIVRRCRAALHPMTAQPGDWGLCHGDLFLNNSRLKADKMVMFDFDWCAFGWRALDLATFRWGTRWFKVEDVAWTPFIDEYLRIRPSAASSLKMLRSFTVLRHLWHISQWIRTAAMTGEHLLADGCLEDLISQCEQIEADPNLSC